MTEAAHNLIERTVIGNVGLANRLQRLVRKHCSHRNVRQYGRTVDLAQEWFLSVRYDEMVEERQYAFLEREDVGEWLDILLKWTDGDAFVNRMMESETVSDPFKAYLIWRSDMLVGSTLRLNQTPFDYRKCIPEVGCWNDYYLDAQYASRFDPGIYDLFTDRTKSEVQVLLEFDLMGYEWMWDVLEVAALVCPQLVNKIIHYKLDEIAKFASPLEIARFSISETHVDVKALMGRANDISRKWPNVYRDLYRGWLSKTRSSQTANPFTVRIA